MATPSQAHAATPFYSTSHSRNTHIFQPPKSPASTSASSALATSTDYFSPRSRKRQRPDSSHSIDAQQTPWTASPSWVQCPTPSDGMYGSAGAHRSALVNERYRLAGGYDTPSLMAAEEREYARRDGDLEFRRRVRDIDGIDRRTTSGAPIAGPLARERNGVARMHSSPNEEQNGGGWTSFAFILVGKVVTFGTNVFRGFYAGGGKGYELQQQQQPSPSDSWMQQLSRRGGTPVPGSWQEDDFLGDFEQDNPSNSPIVSRMRPPNKRRQTDKDTWVMVGTPDASDLSPKRKSSSTSIPRSRPTASRASSRRSLAPVSRPQSSFISHASSAALQATPTNPSHYPRASIAPTRSPQGRPSSAGLPQGISPEAEHLVKRKVKQEKATDKTMNHMNRQLKDLIRQAQAALGTKYEVEGAEDVDEGFVDEEW